MITISEIVKQTIRNKPFIEEALQIDIINLSSYARLLKSDIEKQLLKSVEIGAIIMALKRVKTSMKMNDEKNMCFNQRPEIILRSQLVEITYENSDGLIEKVGKLFHPSTYTKDLFCAITQGVFETALIINTSFYPQLKKIFYKEKLIAWLENLTAITIRLPKENVQTPGVYYRILKALAWNNVNVIDVVSTNTEFTILLHENEVEAGFSAIKKIFK